MGDETSPLIYLAGPSVFRTDALDYALWLLELCRKYQLRGLCPIDIEADSVPRADYIFRHNTDRIALCDIVMADLNPFCGQEPESGTCFEVGYAMALGKEVYGHIRTEVTVEPRELNRMLTAAVRLVHGEEEACLREIAACWQRKTLGEKFQLKTPMELTPAGLFTRHSYACSR